MSRTQLCQDSAWLHTARTAAPSCVLDSVFLASGERTWKFAGCSDPALQNARLVLQVVLHGNIIGSGLVSTFGNIALDWLMYFNCSVFLFMTAQPASQSVEEGRFLYHI